MRLAIVTLLLAGLAPAVEPPVFSSYLEMAAQSKDAPAAVAAIARDYVAKHAVLSGKDIVFEARLRALESPGAAEAIGAALDLELKGLEQRRAALLADSLRRLRETLGDAGFAAFERAVEAWHTELTSRPRPRAK